MGWSSRSGRAVTNPNSPRAQAVCDRCGMWYSHYTLVWQYEWSATRLYNKRLLVCTRTCLDRPQPQLQARILPPDPVPIRDPRPEWFALDNAGGIGGAVIINEDGNTIVNEDGAPIAIE